MAYRVSACCMCIYCTVEQVYNMWLPLSPHQGQCKGPTTFKPNVCVCHPNCERERLLKSTSCTGLSRTLISHISPPSNVEIIFYILHYCMFYMFFFTSVEFVAHVFGVYSSLTNDSFSAASQIAIAVCAQSMTEEPRSNCALMQEVETPTSTKSF